MDYGNSEIWQQQGREVGRRVDCREVERKK